MTKENFSIPVLMYHHVNPDGDSINVKPQIFEKHIRHLKEEGYTALHTDEFLSIMKGRQLPPEKPIMITFDDGWLDNWLFAFPVLQKYDMKAVVFVVTSRVAEKGRRQRSDEGAITSLPSHKACEEMIEGDCKSEVMLSWEELGEMEASGLIDIQSHTHTHQRWNRLSSEKNTSRDMLCRELEMSKKIIEDKLGKLCSAFCWPWGINNREYIDIAKSSGYELLFTTEKGTNTNTTEQWKIKRIVIGNISRFTFRKKLFIHSRDWLSKAYLKIF